MCVCVSCLCICSVEGGEMRAMAPSQHSSISFPEHRNQGYHHILTDAHRRSKAVYSKCGSSTQTCRVSFLGNGDACICTQSWGPVDWDDKQVATIELGQYKCRCGRCVISIYRGRAATPKSGCHNCGNCNRPPHQGHY